MSKINSNKRISFILVTKDRPDLVQIALDNIKKILTKEDELILINGGENNISNPLINKTIKEKDKSPGHAINKGIMISEGRYIRTVSDDDIIRKQQFNEAIDILDKNLSIDFLVCGGIRERENERYPFYIPKNSNYGESMQDISKFGANKTKGAFANNIINQYKNSKNLPIITFVPNQIYCLTGYWIEKYKPGMFISIFYEKSKQRINNYKDIKKEVDEFIKNINSEFKSIDKEIKDFL